MCTHMNYMQNSVNLQHLPKEPVFEMKKGPELLKTSELFTHLQFSTV
jgi:hypothetical protein